MQNSASNQLPLATSKNDIVQTDILNHAEYLNYAQSNSPQHLPQEPKRYTKPLPPSQAKQNKDGANAARTARITLVSMILDQHNKEFMKALKQIGEDLQIKKIMLNIGEKEFKSRYLLRKELKYFFSNIFDKVSEQSIEASIRKNKNSPLDYKARIQLCYQYISSYKACFLEMYQVPPVLTPIKLKPVQYNEYMKSKGYEGY